MFFHFSLSLIHFFFSYSLTVNNPLHLSGFIVVIAVEIIKEKRHNILMIYLLINRYQIEQNCEILTLPNVICEKVNTAKVTAIGFRLSDPQFRFVIHYSTSIFKLTAPGNPKWSTISLLTSIDGA